MTANLHNVDVASGEVLTPEALQLTQRQAVALLQFYVRARSFAVDAKRDQDALGAQIKGYLEAHPGEELHDGELGIVARLQRRRGADRFDVMSMNDELVLALKALGALSLDRDWIKAMAGKCSEADEAKRFVVPAGEIVALDVREER